jgi:hypothetical protein
VDETFMITVFFRKGQGLSQPAGGKPAPSTPQKARDKDFWEFLEAFSKKGLGLQSPLFPLDKGVSRYYNNTSKRSSGQGEIPGRQ